MFMSYIVSFYDSFAGGIDSDEQIDEMGDINKTVNVLPEPVRSAVYWATVKLEMAELMEVHIYI